MKIKYHFTPWATCTIEGEIEVDDSATNDEIDELVREEIFGSGIEWGWIRAEEEQRNE